jgi:uncharacterized protein
MHNIVFFFTGIIVGVMNAVAGGGMLIGFPTLVALGIPPLVANMTGGVISAPGQVASAWGYRQYLRRVPLKFAWLLVPLVIGAAVGATVLRRTSADGFATIVPWLVLFGVLLFAFQPYIHLHLQRHLHGKKRTIPFVFVMVALLPMAFYGGYFGAGIGFMMLAFLSFAHLPDMHMINGMKNIGAMFIAGTTLACLFSSHLIDWRVGGIAAAGAIVGGYSGSRLSQRISSRWLRIVVVAAGFSAVIYLALQHY